MTELALSARDRAMLDGDHGGVARTAMRIIARIARIQGATDLVDVSHVHVGGSIYTGPGRLEVIETLVERGARVRVPTTINAISIDRQRWRTQNVDADFADKADRLATAFEKLGASPIFSCTPYVFPDGPRYGQDIVWAESNAIVYANSVIGARTNRHGDFLDVCAAITGRAPLAGFHLPRNRRGSFLVRVPPMGRFDGSFYTALGYLVGRNAGDLVPVIDGIPDTPSTEDLKAFCAAVSTSGPVGMFHMVGVTPEAPTLDGALGGRSPVKTLDVTTSDLLDTVHSLSTEEAGSALDMVVLGSPHFTLGDFAELAELVEGRTCDPRIDILITTSRFVLDHAVQHGWAQTIEEFGARFSTDTCLCMLNPHMFAPGTRTVMTNSGKFAHYGPGLVQRRIYFGTLGDCVESAVAGTLRTTTPAWAAS
jgi:cis-L-3-hydroxyproline dehydratase